MAGPELLLLAKHAEPHVDPNLPAREWALNAAGELGATRLAEAWSPVGVDLVVSSVERKAKETATIVADRLGVMFHTGHDLHEHERPFMADRDQFQQFMASFFAEPNLHRAVEARFTSAVDALVKAHRGSRLGIVAHGTVLSLHLAARYGLDGWKTWKALGMPSYAVVETRTKTVVDLVENV